MKNNIKQISKEINGVKYVAQGGSARLFYRFTDASRDKSGNASVEKSAEFILKEVIVDPKNISLDELTPDEANEIVKLGTEVLQGNFRKKDTDTTEKDSEE